MRSLFFSATLCVFLGCPALIGAQADSDVDPEHDEYAVYSAVIVTSFLTSKTGTQLIIANATCRGMVVKTIDDINFLVQTPSFPFATKEKPSPLSPDTFANYLERNAQTQVLKNLFHSKVGYALVDYDEIERLAGRLDNFKNFHLRYPGAHGFITLSRIGFNRKRDQALVFTTWTCGDLCGEGWFVLLSRVNGEWQVIREALIIIS